MPEPPPLEPPLVPAPPADGAVFLRRLQVATCVLLLVFLVVRLLVEFGAVLKPLFVALFLGFLMQPIHRWLVKRGIPSLVSYAVILVVVALGVFAFGSMLYANITQVVDRWADYEVRLEKRIGDLAASLPFETPELEPHFLRTIIRPTQLEPAVRAILGQFGDFTSWAILTFVYLLFLIAERVGFPRRTVLAFGEAHGLHILIVADSISLAIGEYIAVKTLVSALAGVLSYAVLALFGVEFAATWGILIFLLNYIPYLGSLVAVSLPIVLSFVQFDELWKGIAIAVALVGIQQVIGTFVEPRMAGERLDVSPLLILLSLAFWGAIWGIVGMILAVPLLVIVRIVLDTIPETKPLATLMSNR